MNEWLSECSNACRNVESLDMHGRHTKSSEARRVATRRVHQLKSRNLLSPKEESPNGVGVCVCTVH